MATTMSDIMNPGTATHDDHFPDAPTDWTQENAEQAARAAGIELGEDHWKTIKAIQDFYQRHERIQVRELHDALGESFHAKGGLKYLYEIFPGGPVAQGCQFAGLQPPAGATDKSFGSVQ